METKGVTAFPLTVRPREYIKDLCEYITEHGYNCLSAGAQAWTPAQAKDHPILPFSPPIGGREWKKNLETMLDETARHDNMFVQLIPTFGHKQHDTDPDGQEMAWHIAHAKRIIGIIKTAGYKHIYINLVNELKHPLTDNELKGGIIELGKVFQDAGFMITSDHGGREKDTTTGERIWKAYYPEAWQHFNAFAWHPTRNPEPTSNQFRKAHERWEHKCLLYNETTCFADDSDMAKWPHLRGAGTIAGEGKVDGEAQKWIIRRLKERIKTAGPRSRFFFHSIWLGIRGGLDTPLGWLPVY